MVISLLFVLANRNWYQPCQNNILFIYYSWIYSLAFWPSMTSVVEFANKLESWFFVDFCWCSPLGSVQWFVRSLCWLRKCGCSCVFVFKENWLNIAWNIWSIQNIEYNVLYIKYKRYRNLWIIKFIQGQIYVGAEKVRLRCNFGSWFPLWHPIMVWRFIHLIEWLS